MIALSKFCVFGLELILEIRLEARIGQRVTAPVIPSAGRNDRWFA